MLVVSIGEGFDESQKVKPTVNGHRDVNRQQDKQAEKEGNRKELPWF
jgi:hypothetical protein